MLGSEAACCQYGGSRGVGVGLPSLNVNFSSGARAGAAGGGAGGSGASNGLDANGNPISDGASASAAVANGGGSALALRTTNGRDIAFPLSNPFSPIIKTRTPVSGMNAWPYMAKPGRHYFGLDGDKGEGFHAFGGFGDDTGDYNDYGWAIDPTPIPQTTGIVPSIKPVSVYSQATFPQQPSTLQTILSSLPHILPTIPGIISSAEGKPYYNPAQLPQQPVYGSQQPGLVPTQGSGSLTNVGATVGNSIGNLSASLANFVATNPLIVLGGVAALFLLMREPPRRR